MNIQKIQEILKDQPKFRAKQVYEAIFQKFVENWDEVTVLPAALRERLKAEAPLLIPAEVLESADKSTVKASISLPGGKIETVLMRHEDGRNTVCVSSQMGCRLACAFCLTGRGGFIRDLDSYEIVAQVLFFARYLKGQTLVEERETAGRVSNVVFMGMGEPFMNYAEVMKAVKFLNDKETFNIGARKISISTVGLIDGIKKLASEPFQVNLAVSLHAPNDEIRNDIMPVSRGNPMKSLMRAIAEYIRKTNRKVMIEYVMLDKINDSEEDAKELALVLKLNLPGLYMVNLVSYNPTDEHRSSPPEKIKAFKKILEDEGVEVVQRYKFGRDIKGACGQLAGK